MVLKFIKHSIVPDVFIPDAVITIPNFVAMINFSLPWIL